MTELETTYYTWAKSHRGIAKLMHPVLFLLRETSPEACNQVLKMLIAGKCHIAITECMIEFLDTHKEYYKTFGEDLIAELNKI